MDRICFHLCSFVCFVGKINTVTQDRLYAIFCAVKKKSYAAVKKVREFIAEQPDEVQAEYLKIVEFLEADGRLIEPFGKRLIGSFSKYGCGAGNRFVCSIFTFWMIS